MGISACRQTRAPRSNGIVQCSWKWMLRRQPVIGRDNPRARALGKAPCDVTIECRGSRGITAAVQEQDLAITRRAVFPNYGR
jgi:hypothetical protein